MYGDSSPFAHGFFREYTISTLLRDEDTKTIGRNNEMGISPAARGSHGFYQLHGQPRTAGQELAMGRLNATQTSERADDRNGGGVSR